MKIYNAQGQPVDTAGLMDEYGRPIETLDYGARMAEAQHGILGANPEDHPKFAGYTKVVAQYPVNIELYSDPTDRRASNAGSAPLRPEPFVCKGITWASDGDVPRPEEGIYYEDMMPSGSTVGRVVEMRWYDEFAQFMGDRWAFITAVLGDSNGFYNLARPILFQGKQSIKIALRVVRYPHPPPYELPYPTWRFDFVFHGIGLLPPGEQISGSSKPG